MRSLAVIWRTLILRALIVPVWSVARSAELDDVQLPDALQANGKTLHLNGLGLRTDSLLAVHIHVAIYERRWRGVSFWLSDHAPQCRHLPEELLSWLRGAA